MDQAPGSDRVRRRRSAAVAGYRGDVSSARELAEDSDVSVRSAALGALARLGQWDAALVGRALADPEPTLRRRACELTGRVAQHHRETGQIEDPWTMAAAMLTALDDDPAVAEAAAWALGELGASSNLSGTSSPASGGRTSPLGRTSRSSSDAASSTTDTGPAPPGASPRWALVVSRLISTAEVHPDLLVRESAVAALGSIGDPAGLPAVLKALEGKPALRRRAAVALAAFDDPRVDNALRECLTDRDWQVREVAEELLGPNQ